MKGLNRDKPLQQDDSVGVSLQLISKKNALCVQIAALCHDLGKILSALTRALRNCYIHAGHGPFSHLYDLLNLKPEHADKPTNHKLKKVHHFSSVYIPVIEIHRLVLFSCT